MMDMAEYLRKVDAQMAVEREREKLIVRGERRQQQQPVAVERRSGEDRRGKRQRSGDK